MGHGGRGTPTDDPSIPDDEELWRRIPPHHFFFDDADGRLRPASAAFDNDPDGSPMSVFLASGTPGPDAALAGHDGHALAAITAGLARANGQGVVRAPLPGLPSHAHVEGPKPKSIQRRLARAARWVVPPPDTSGPGSPYIPNSV